jgi:hypothetical protein
LSEPIAASTTYHALYYIGADPSVLRSIGYTACIDSRKVSHEMRVQSKLTDVQRLTHVHTKQLIEHLFDGPWITLYRYARGEQSASDQYSALVSKKVLPKILKQRGWDLTIGDGLPGYSTLYGKTVRYDRFSGEGIEPLVIIRNFAGIKPVVIEIVEEFRHFHNLYEEPKSGRFVKIDDNGDDEVVAEVTNDRVRVRKPALAEFLAAKQMYLALFFEFDEKLAGGPNPVCEADREEYVSGTDRIWGRHMGDMEDKIFSRLMGKRVITPPRRPKVGDLWKRSKQDENFIIGYHEDGKELLYNSNPDRLSNYFGANAGAPHYLTPVHFRREVLDKYYADPDRFSVSDGYLSRGSLWSMRIDNDHPNDVIAFLGDLGRDLPSNEQLHWKSHNIPPQARMSEVAIRRSFFGEFADPSRPDHVFKSKCMQFNNAWTKNFGWSLFRPLLAEDAHVFERVHIPSGNGATEFESQILGLAKIMVDSINDAELAKALGGSLENEKSLGKLERYLLAQGYPDADRDMRLLRGLQALRSKGVAHRKGQDHANVAQKLGFDGKTPPEIITTILKSLCLMLDNLEAHFIL